MALDGIKFGQITGNGSEIKRAEGTTTVSNPIIQGGRLAAGDEVNFSHGAKEMPMMPSTGKAFKATVMENLYMLSSAKLSGTGGY